MPINQTKRTIKAPRIQNGKLIGQDSREEITELDRTVEMGKVNNFRAAREPQKIAQRLAREGYELRAEKVSQIRKLIAKGAYEVEPREVAKSIVRAEISGHVQKTKVQSINIVLEALLALTEEGNCGEERNGGENWGIKRSPSHRGMPPRLPSKSIRKQA